MKAVFPLSRYGSSEYGRYLSNLLAGQSALPALAGLGRLRADAVDRVGVLTVPTTHDEEWRFTDISALTKLSFQPARSAPEIAAAQYKLTAAANLRLLERPAGWPLAKVR